MSLNSFVRPCKQIMNAFYTIFPFHFKLQILYACKPASLSWWKSTQVWGGAFFSRKWVKLTQGEVFSIFHFKSVVKNGQVPLNFNLMDFCLWSGIQRHAIKILIFGWGSWFFHLIALRRMDEIEHLMVAWIKETRCHTLGLFAWFTQVLS